MTAHIPGQQLQGPLGGGPFAWGWAPLPLASASCRPGQQYVVKLLSWPAKSCCCSTFSFRAPPSKLRRPAALAAGVLIKLSCVQPDAAARSVAPTHSAPWIWQACRQQTMEASYSGRCPAAA